MEQCGFVPSKKNRVKKYSDHFLSAASLVGFSTLGAAHCECGSLLSPINPHVTSSPHPLKKLFGHISILGTLSYHPETSDYWETLTIFKSPQLQEDLLAFERMWEKIQIQGRKKRPKGPKKWPNIPTEFLLTFVCWLTHEYLKSFLLNQSSDGQTSEKSDWCFGKWQKNISDSQHNIWYDAFDIFQKCFTYFRYFILINFKTLDSTFRKTSLGPRRIFLLRGILEPIKLKPFCFETQQCRFFLCGLSKLVKASILEDIIKIFVENVLMHFWSMP